MSDWNWGSWAVEAAGSAAEELTLGLIYDFEREHGTWDASAGTGDAVNKEYAEVRRAVAGATRIARAEYAGDRHRADGTWMMRAQREAVAHLSLVDPVFVDLMVEACVWCVDREDWSRLRGVLASSTSGAAVVHGPDSDAAHRLGRCWDRAGALSYSRSERAVERADERLSRAEAKSGPTSEAALKAMWKLADRYEDAFKPGLLVRLMKRKHAELIEAHGADDARVARFARAAAQACHRVGRADDAARLHQEYYQWRLRELGSGVEAPGGMTNSGEPIPAATTAPGRTEAPGPTDAERFDALESEIRAELDMSEILQPVGDAGRAEQHARRAVRRLQDLMDRTRSRSDYRRVDALRHEAHFQLGAALLQHGRRAEAHQTFRAAFHYLSPGGLERPTASLYYSAMVYTGDRWREFYREPDVGREWL